MPHSDFDMHTLARYLHLTPQQVAKLADRGKLPGRKVSGEWRFSKADIHHWLETRIGLSDEEELIGVRGRFAAGGPGGTARAGDFHQPRCFRWKRLPCRCPPARATR